MLRPLALLLAILLAHPAWPQEPGKRLTNQDIIEMTNLGLSDDVIVAKIRSAMAPTPPNSIPASTASKPSKLPTSPTPSSK